MIIKQQLKKLLLNINFILLEHYMIKYYFIFYWAFLVTTFSVYFINQSIINRFKKKSNKLKDNFNSLVSMCIDYRKSFECNNTPNVIYGKIYYYDMSKNTINIEKKTSYSEYDLFVFLHEFGHYIECQRCHDIYYFINIINLCIYPIFFITFTIDIVYLINKINANMFFYIINLVSVIIFIIKFLFIYAIEYNASEWALNFLKYLNKKDNKIKQIIRLAIINQYLFYLFLFIPLSFLIIFILI